MDPITVTGYARRPPYIIGMQKGIFAKEGIDVQFEIVKLAPKHNREMAEGVWNMSLQSADTMLARMIGDGIDYVLFMQVEEGLDVQLVARPGFSRLEELKGKLFAADPIDSNFDLVRNKIMLDHGMPEDQYGIEIIGNTPIRLEAFLAGKVDAAMLAPPFTDRAVAAGGVILAEGSDYIQSWPHTCGWGLRSWVEANRPLLVRFIRAWATATDWMLKPENREEAIEIVMRDQGMTRARAEDACAHVVPSGRINPLALRRNIEYRIELGYYPPPHRPTEAFYDASLWQEATGLAPAAPAGMPRNAANAQAGARASAQ